MKIAHRKLTPSLQKNISWGKQNSWKMNFFWDGLFSRAFLVSGSVKLSKEKNPWQITNYNL